jgi:hypothetical protein
MKTPISSSCLGVVQGNIKLSPVTPMGHEIFVLVQKESNVEDKKVLVCTLKDCLPSLPQNKKAKK